MAVFPAIATIVNVWLPKTSNLHHCEPLDLLKTQSLVSHWINRQYIAEHSPAHWAKPKAL